MAMSPRLKRTLMPGRRTEARKVEGLEADEVAVGACPIAQM